MVFGVGRDCVVYYNFRVRLPECSTGCYGDEEQQDHSHESLRHLQLQWKVVACWLTPSRKLTPLLIRALCHSASDLFLILLSTAPARHKGCHVNDDSYNYIPVTNSMAYRTRRFNAAFARAL